MSGYGRQWLLVVLVCISLLTLFTANGLPLLDQDAGFGIKDDPAENQVLSLSERDAKEEDSSDSTPSLNVAGLAENTATNTTANTTNTSARPGLQNTTKSPKPLNNSGLNITSDFFNTKNLTTTASPQNLSINATRTGNITLRLTSIQSSPVNILINPSQTIKVVPKNSSGSSLSTYTNSLKPSLTRTPSESSVKLSAIGSPSVSLNPSQSAAILTNPTTGVSSVVPTRVSSSTTSIPSTQGSPQNTSLSAKNSTGAVSTQSRLGTSSPNNKTRIPSTQSSSGAPSVQGTSSAPSTQNPSTKATTEVSSTQKTQATTSLSTAPSTGVLSSLPPTTEVKAPKSATNNVISEKPSTKMSTKESTRKPSTQASKKPSTKETSIAPSTKKALSTVPKEPTTNAEVQTTKKSTTKKATTKKATTKKATTKKATTKKATTKKATTKPVVSEKKTTAVKTKASNENNDEGEMPTPDQGREAVLWDFIVPVAIGTGVALAIAFGVILVRTCRRRKLIKVRFGGKPSHPRLLNNDLINLLAESDDEEE